MHLLKEVNLQKEIDKLKAISRIISVEDLEKFKKWKKKKIYCNLLSLLISIVFLSFLTTIFYKSGEFRFETIKDILVVILFVTMFILCLYLVIKNLYNSFKRTLEYCNYGVVIEKYDSLFGKIDYKPSNIDRSYKNKTYHVIVRVEDKTIDVIVSSDEYKDFNLNDLVFIFITNETKIYLLKNNK